MRKSKYLIIPPFSISILDSNKELTSFHKDLTFLDLCRYINLKVLPSNFLKNYDNVKYLFLPNSIYLISQNALSNKKLIYVNFVSLKNIVSIEKCAFFNNYIKYLNLSYSKKLKFIDDEAFAFNNIYRMHLPDNISLIANECFRNNKLKKIDLSNIKSLLTFFSSVFVYNQIEDIIFSSSIVKLGSSSFENNNLVNLDLSKLTNIISIPYRCFCNNHIETVILPNNISKIESFAFSHNDIKSLYMKNLLKLNKIGSNAFLSNNNLSYIEINQNVNIFETFNVDRWGRFVRYYQMILNKGGTYVFSNGMWKFYKTF